MIDGIIFILTDFALETEKILELGYKFIRSHPPYDSILFSLLAIYLLFSFSKLFKKDKILTYKITDESEIETVMNFIKSKNQEILNSLEPLDTTKQTQTQQKYASILENACKELEAIQELYNEFQEEIVDSHQSICESLRLPVMK
jgi:hypothetical protein